LETFTAAQKRGAARTIDGGNARLRLATLFALLHPMKFYDQSVLDESSRPVRERRNASDATRAAPREATTLEIA